MKDDKTIQQQDNKTGATTGASKTTGKDETRTQTQKPSQPQQPTTKESKL